MNTIAGPADPPQLHDRARGLLIGAGLGDAMGAAFEGRTNITDLALREHEASTRRLTYTDDTALTIAVAEHLLHRADQGGHVLNEAELASGLANTWKAEPWRGYGAAAGSLFDQVSSGASWRATATSLFGGKGSYGNGGAMRCTPIALVAKSAHHAAELGRRSALVTHMHPDAQHGAAVQACGAYFALHSPTDRPIEPQSFIERLVKTIRDPEWEERLRTVRDHLGHCDPRRAAKAIGNDVRATHSVPLALWAFLTHPDNPVEVVRQCIRAGGDTDTIASMAGALAGARHGCSAWPSNWIGRLEGSRRLHELADRLGSHHLLAPS